MLKVAVTPALENNTKIGIRSTLFPKNSSGKPPASDRENQNIKVNLIPNFLYIIPLTIMEGSSLIEEENVLRNTLPGMFFIWKFRR